MYFLILLFNLILLYYVNSFNNIEFKHKFKFNCNKAPNKAKQIMCENLMNNRINFENGQKELSELSKEFINMTGDVPDLIINNQTIGDCINLGCCCPFLGGYSNGSVNDCTLPNGQLFKKSIRKELRMMTDKELLNLFICIRKLKNSGEYDDFAELHKKAFELGGAHGGPAFLLFHRELTKRYELLIRKCNPDLFLPYWDSTLDGRLPFPKNSCLFTEKFLGSTHSSNYVINGPFSPWKTIEGNPYITRTVGEMGDCFTDIEIEDVYNQTDIKNVLAYSMPYSECNITLNWEWLEYPHGNPHGYIGGEMTTPKTSANDPCFYFLHCFVDFIFEGWRLKRQNRYQRENDYPPDISACESSVHYKYSTMAQFYPLKNIDGLRNEYTDNMYEYSPRPTCTVNNPDCGSKWLFCDLSHGEPHCAAKACLGGNCSGFINGEDVCFESICLNDICVEITTKTLLETENTVSFCKINTTNTCQCLCTFV